jgi:hypothetical protein
MNGSRVRCTATTERREWWLRLANSQPSRESTSGTMQMLKQWQFILLTVIAVVAVALAVTNMAMFVQNRDLQIQASTRTQFIQQGAQLQNLYRDLMNGLADLAVRNQDQGLRDLLAAQGVSLNAPQTPPPGTAMPHTGPSTGDPRQGAKK